MLSHLEVLEVRSLLIHNLGQELVFQSISGHSKINKGGLGLDLWLVVRIGQFSVQDQSEARVEEALLVPDLYTTVRERDRKGSGDGAGEKNAEM